MNSSEYQTLKRVVLFCPQEPFEYSGEPQAVFHKSPVDLSLLRSEWESYKKLLESLGVEVLVIPTQDSKSQWNMTYCRDLFWSTPWGAVPARLTHPLRQAEEPHLQNLFKQCHVPQWTMSWKDETFEGADALWVRPDHVVIGVGHRTSEGAFQILKSSLNDRGVQVTALPCSHRQCQHLLGVVQIIDENLVLLRSEIAHPDVREFFCRENYEIIDIAESEDVAQRQAMNLVCVGPKEVLLPSDADTLTPVLERRGVHCHRVGSIEQFINGGGGLACATGILERSRK